MESLIVSVPSLSWLLISTPTASVLSRPRAVFWGDLWLSLWHPAQRGDPGTFLGGGGGDLARGLLNS